MYVLRPFWPSAGSSRMLMRPLRGLSQLRSEIKGQNVSTPSSAIRRHRWSYILQCELVASLDLEVALIRVAGRRGDVELFAVGIVITCLALCGCRSGHGSDEEEASSVGEAHCGELNEGKSSSESVAAGYIRQRKMSVRIADGERCNRKVVVTTIAVRMDYSFLLDVRTPAHTEQQLSHTCP